MTSLLRRAALGAPLTPVAGQDDRALAPHERTVGSAGDSAVPVETRRAGRALAGDSRPADRPMDQGEFVAAVTPHYPALVRRLVLVLGNLPDAEDVAQDAYLRALEGWPRFDGSDARAWLYTIGLRLAFNHLRSRRRRLAAIACLAPPPWEDAVDPDLAAALGRLDPKVRAAVVLHSVDGYTHAEVGRLLGAPEGTVASWVSRGRAQLRVLLAQPTEP